MSHKYFLKFPEEIIGQPVLYTLGQEFSIVPNIRGASISEEQALMAVELEGEDAEVEKAVAWLIDQGIGVESLRPDEQLPF